MQVKIDDLTFIVSNKNEHQQRHWISGKFYEKKMLDFIKRNHKPGVFVDVGSCIGNHTMYFSTIAKEVYSFEPDVDNFTQQSNIVKLNNTLNVKMFNIAIGYANKLNRFKKAPASNIGQGTITEQGTEIVPTFRLDEFNLTDVTLIKIDVEGHEEQVIKGATNTIKTNTPDIFIECSSKEDKETRLSILKSIDIRYEMYKTQFNATPTYLFTIKDFKEFK